MPSDSTKFKPQTRCRVCEGEFFSAPLMALHGMPAAAQNFPDAASLNADHGVDLEVCQCACCGLVQLSNPPVSYYRDVIRAAAFSEEMRDFRINQFKTFVDQHNLAGKNVLELGCGRGEYLGLMAAAGARAFGLEHLDESVEACLTEGLQVSRGYPDTPGMQIDGGPFDAFFIMNFFEHLPDPNTALGVMVENLTEDGVGLIEVPNFDAIVEKKLFSEFINDHLFYFTRDTLTSTLERNGFEVIATESIWYDYILSATVVKRKPTSLAPLNDYQSKIAAELTNYLTSKSAKKCAVWGAGHQALAVIALSDTASLLDCVLDSAPFKQGKYTPASHLLIKDPSAIDTDHLDLVIVMAAGYSDEVVKLINQRHPEGVSHLTDVAVLRDYGLEIIRG